MLQSNGLFYAITQHKGLKIHANNRRRLSAFLNLLSLIFHWQFWSFDDETSRLDTDLISDAAGAEQSKFARG
jgi:hypothetical protein